MTAADLDRCEPFLRAITDAPGDSLPRLVMADWLDDHSWWREAAGQRWAAREGKYPLPYRPPEHPEWFGGWYTDFLPGDDPADRRPGHSELPALFDDVTTPTGRDLVACEVAFLRACAQLDWPAGEPARPTEVTP